ncbi:hypothetical protein ZIOFF_055971 [Zingiber officinale]|uniref:Uncharacterized protein n=1 Tax=Zingiber officinale TaxID=94328 RepID=A0A8J5KSK8_ZINOF|nr:hypothetical protein ZIOFF_055971 [Zingiber officinale]
MLCRLCALAIAASCSIVASSSLPSFAKTLPLLGESPLVVRVKRPSNHIRELELELCPIVSKFKMSNSWTFVQATLHSVPLLRLPRPSLTLRPSSLHKHMASCCAPSSGTPRSSQLHSLTSLLHYGAIMAAAQAPSALAVTGDNNMEDDLLTTLLGGGAILFVYLFVVPVTHNHELAKAEMVQAQVPGDLSAVYVRLPLLPWVVVMGSIHQLQAVSKGSNDGVSLVNAQRRCPSIQTQKID